MLNIRSDYQNLQKQLESLGYDPVGKESSKIIKAVIAACLSLAEAGLSKESLKTALNLLQPDSRMAMDAWFREHEEVQWGEFDYGNTKIGDFVRVKKDAYDSSSGEPHNGLVGKLTYMRNGKCTVEYIGLGAGNSSFHPMEKLESMKRV